MQARLKFARERRNWTVDDWKRVIWSDESTFELTHSSSKRVDRIWATSAADVPVQELVKNPPKTMVWGCMSFQAVSELHFLAKGETINTEYYVVQILTKSLLPTWKRKSVSGDILTRKLHPTMSRAIFQQDGAPPHTSVKAQSWLRENIPSFWEKGIWPGNSPDLSPDRKSVV